MLHVCYFYQSCCQEYNFGSGDSSWLWGQQGPIRYRKEDRASQLWFVPFSPSTLATLQTFPAGSRGYFNSQQCVTTVEARAVHEYASTRKYFTHPKCQVLPNQHTHLTSLSHQVCQSHPQNHNQLIYHGQPNYHIPFKLHLYQPATEKGEILVLNELKTIITETLVTNKTYNDKKISLLTEMNERYRQRHNLEMKTHG